MYLPTYDSFNQVTGPYDIITYVELPSTEGLQGLIEQIHKVTGVIRTETCISI